MRPGDHVRLRQRGAKRAWLLVLWLAPLGCNTALRQKKPPTITDRLIATYPDLRNGRFVVLADFEQPQQAELFHIRSLSRRSSCGLSLTGGVPSTGTRCLRVEFSESADVLLADNSTAGEWFLKRDWRDFDLLMMSIYCSAPSAAAEVSVVSGDAADRTTVHARLTLRRGWNRIRLDLNEAAEHAALDNVQALRWSLADITEPVRLMIDDLVLTANRADLFGSAGGRDGAMYVRERGRRWNIGAVGRFEVALAHGQVLQWFDLARDPHRLHNLVDDTVLGPSPVVLPADVDEDGESERDWPGGFDVLGDTTVARQQIIEANAVRVVVACEWRMVQAGQRPTASSPFQRWRYTFYRSGQVYVHTECTAKIEGWDAPDLGLAVSRVADEASRIVRHSVGALDERLELGRTSFGSICPDGPDDSGVLFIVHDGRTAPVMTALHDHEQRRGSLIASGGNIRDAVYTWDSQLVVWPPAACLEDEAAARALDYCYPVPIEPEVGRLVTDSAGDRDGDGFDETHGCYVLAPDGNRLQLLLDGSPRPLYSPAFVVTGTAGRQAWVYVNQTLLDSCTRSSDGDLLFQIPGTLTGRTLVEVYLRVRDTSTHA